ncbi:hypothetical protein LTR56_024910 [Elasticomyces elasticus]|nr:hypothetical protein LTR56_024910 [Elasticomyces elasticus]KAK4905484.1 hypothetical protein LTR49_025219 [Elasticomyces elasticus]KAK5752566.1 hypothetical protein LTS12_017316 [Elasticomyces elasticus]
MPAANPASIDVNAIPRRVPKLAVRSRTSQDDERATTSTNDAVRPPSSTRSSERSVALSLARTISERSQGSIDRSKSASHGSTELKIQGNNEKAKKKKGSGVLGFLSLKEPSASALEEFAKAQKKASAAKGSRPGSVALPGVSSQKLPDTVPATNAKWDGLPDSAKRTSRTRWSSFSDGNSDQSPARRYGSVSSKPPRPDTAPTPSSKRSSVQSHVSTGCRKLPNPPVPTAVHPAFRNTAVTPWDEPPEQSEQPPERSPETFLHPPSPPLNPDDPSALLPTPELELPEILVLGGHVTSPEPSPRTPPTEYQRYLGSRANESRNAQVAYHEQYGTFWHSDTDNDSDVAKSCSAQEAGAKAGRSAVRMGYMPSKQGLSVEPVIDEDEEEDDVLQPTLRDENGRTSPFIFESSSMNRRQLSPASQAMTPRTLTQTLTPTASTLATPAVSQQSQSRSPARTSRAASPASSLRSGNYHMSSSPARTNSDTPSVVPSVIPAQWKLSPKERLGLGGKISRRTQPDVLPWEDEALPNAPKRLSGAQAALDGSVKLKRLSMRLGRKL